MIAPTAIASLALAVFSDGNDEDFWTKMQRAILFHDLAISNEAFEALSMEQERVVDEFLRRNWRNAETLADMKFLLEIMALMSAWQSLTDELARAPLPRRFGGREILGVHMDQFPEMSKNELTSILERLRGNEDLDVLDMIECEVSRVVSWSETEILLRNNTRFGLPGKAFKVIDRDEEWFEAMRNDLIEHVEAEISDRRPPRDFQ